MVTVENKRIRLQDVAKEAKVSVATASMALSDCPDISEGTKQRIRNMSKKLGYQRPADKQLLRQHNEQKPKILRFGFMSVGTRLNDEILTDLLHELTMEAVSIGLRIEVSATDNISNHDALVKQTLAFGHELDGLILTGRVDDNLLSGIEMYHIPCVVVAMFCVPVINFCSLARYSRRTKLVWAASLQTV
jgi:DNA-binding LacI/PurR family transcriptional regulator